MTRRDEREIVRYLEGEELAAGFPCWVGHGSDVDACKRPSTMRVYGLNFCETHGTECAYGALEEMHQNVEEYFGRLMTGEVPALDNPLLHIVGRQWERSTDLKVAIMPREVQATVSSLVVMEKMNSLAQEDRTR